MVIGLFLNLRPRRNHTAYLNIYLQGASGKTLGGESRTQNHKAVMQRASGCAHPLGGAHGRTGWQQSIIERGPRTLQDALHAPSTRPLTQGESPLLQPQRPGAPVKAWEAGSSPLQRPWWAGTATTPSQAPGCPHCPRWTEGRSKHSMCARTARAEEAARKRKPSGN